MFKRTIFRGLTILVILAILTTGVFAAGRTPKPISKRLLPTISIRYYAMTTVVVELDRMEDTVIVEDGNGNLWAFQHVEDWQVGDCACLVMDTMGTNSIYDDMIVSVRYNNWNLSH